MALGYCMECDKLVSINPREIDVKQAPRRNWYPAPHDTPDGKQCSGHKKAIR